MRQEVKEALQCAGIDVEDSLKRLMHNGDFYQRILIKFQEDDTFANYQKAAEAKDWKRVFDELHTLKGVAANLGMTVLTEKVSAAVEKLRGNDLEGIEKEFEELEEAYQNVMHAIRKL